MQNERITPHRISVGKRNVREMGGVCPLGQPVYTGRPDIGM